MNRSGSVDRSLLVFSAAMTALIACVAAFGVYLWLSEDDPTAVPPANVAQSSPSPSASISGAPDPARTPANSLHDRIKKDVEKLRAEGSVEFVATSFSYDPASHSDAPQSPVTPQERRLMKPFLGRWTTTYGGGTLSLAFSIVQGYAQYEGWYGGSGMDMHVTVPMIDFTFQGHVLMWNGMAFQVSKDGQTLSGTQGSETIYLSRD